MLKSTDAADSGNAGLEVIESRYLQRQQAGKCTRPGCDRDPEADSDLCGRHRTLLNERKRKSAAKRRAARRRKGCCAFCPNKSRTYRCPACTVEYNAARAKSTGRPSGAASVDHNGLGSGYVASQILRAKKAGQPRRGRQTTVALDLQDLRDAIKLLSRAHDELAAIDSAAADGMPALQRRDAKRAALARIPLAQRFEDEVLDRNRAVIR